MPPTTTTTTTTAQTTNYHFSTLTNQHHQMVTSITTNDDNDVNSEQQPPNQATTTSSTTTTTTTTITSPRTLTDTMHSSLRESSPEAHELFSCTDALPGAEHLTQLLAKLCDCPSAHISMVDEMHQLIHIRSAYGPLFQNNQVIPLTPLHICPRAIQEARTCVVEDMLQHDFYDDAPFVVERPFLRFFAGAPLITKNGICIGLLCVVDTVPKKLSSISMEVLISMANQIVSLLEARVQMRELEEAKTALEMKNLELEKLSDDKSRVLSIISHDVRQPLSNILVSAEMLLMMSEKNRHNHHQQQHKSTEPPTTSNKSSTPSPSSSSSPSSTLSSPNSDETITSVISSEEEARQLIYNIHASVSFAKVLIDDMLGMSQLDFRYSLDEVQLQRTNVVRLLKSIINQNRLLATRKNIGLDLLLRLPSDDDNNSDSDDGDGDVRDIDQHRHHLCHDKQQRELLTFEQYTQLEDGAPYWRQIFQQSFTCHVDPHKIEQAMNNLVGNAVKFSYPNSRVRVIVSCSTNHVHIEIEDEGQGIPKHEQSTLFTPNHKCSVKPTCGETSTGLGLIIVKNIVNAHRGHIRVDSLVGRGTTFEITIPRESHTYIQQQQEQKNENVEQETATQNESVTQESTQQQDEAQKASAVMISPRKGRRTEHHDRNDSSITRGLHILCAEDNLIAQKLMNIICRKIGHSLTLVSDGQEAFDTILREPHDTFDLIIVDGLMPKMDGLDLIRAVRHRERLLAIDRVPIICVSGQTSVNYQESLREAGADGILSKPFNISQFVQLIETATQNIDAKS